MEAIPHSVILIVHIVSILLGHLMFALACAASLVFLHQEHQLKTKVVKLMVNRFPPLGTLKQISNRSMLLGFVCLTIGVLLGVVLGGGFHSLLDMELRLIFAFFSWAMYAFFLVEQFLRGYQGKKTIIVSSCIIVASLIVDLSYLFY